MKIKISTFHCSYNYGAVLQSYALMRVLEKMGHDVSFLNYIPSNRKIRTSKYLSFAGFSKVECLVNIIKVLCYNKLSNCGKCSKCQRTLLALDLFGKLDNFSKVFNLKDYKTSFVTKRYIARQIIRKNFDLYAKDFVEYAKLNKISLWKKTSVFAYLIEFVIAILRKSRFIHSTFLKYYRRKMNISE